MHTYETLTEAINDLKNRGFVKDFNLKEDHLLCETDSLVLHPENFEVVETYRFEGSTDMDDESILYAIHSRDGIKGILVNAYGIYSDATSDELIKKLKINS